MMLTRTTSACVAAVALALGSGTETARADNQEGDRILGSWQEVLTPDDPLTGGSPFETLVTYAGGGALIASGTIDLAQPGPLSGPTQGTWTQLDRNKWKWHARAFAFDATFTGTTYGNYLGYFDIFEEVTISRDHKSYTGTGTFRVASATPGAPDIIPPTSYTVVATRI